MKKFYMLLALSAIGLTTLSPDASAQDKRAVKLLRKNSDGQTSFVQFNTQDKSVSVTERKAVLKEFLPLGEKDELRIVANQKDELGFEHQKLQQFHQGIKVEYGTYNVHSKSGKISAINGDFIPVERIKLSAGITEQDAFQTALKHVGADQYMWEISGEKAPKGELIIVKNFRAAEKENKKPVLAYKFNVYATQPLSRAYVYVDANTGEIVHENAIIKHAAATGSAATRYSGSRSIGTDSYSGSYRLRDYTRGSGIETYDMNEGTNYNSGVDFTDSDNNWTSGEFNNSAKDNAALDAHWGAQMTYDYFMSKHNRNSWDGNGAKIKSYVHFDSNYENAFWNGSVMTYGDGASRFDALTSLDVAAHEIGHAVCERSANLVYQRESGALNEGFSDIWGAAVEYYAAPEKNTWLIGEDIDQQRPSLRSMSNPNAEGQPDTYGGSYWKEPNCGTPTQYNDYCGVHTNSGVLNYWFYLLSVGGSGTNDIGSAYSVTAIGIDDAAKIAYRTETVYLSSYSTYADARSGAIQSAIDLFGDGSTQHVATTNAWHAVGVGAAYGGGGSGSSYCVSQGNDASYEWIAAVNIGSFSKTSGSTSYSDFTSNEVELEAGSAVSVSLTPGFASSTYNEYWKIYIDYNGDGDFTDAGETAFDAGSLSSSTVTGTINVPSSASGTTRMRVSMKYNGAQSSCESFSYGEVEDYTVTFTEGGTTPPPSVEYCDSKGNSVADEWIDKVVFNGINNITGANGGYGDFTNLVATAGRGGSYSITLSTGYSGTVYKEYWKIWIDLNQDGDFDDAGELMDEGSTQTAGDVTASVNIPTSATLGTTRMRVSMKYNTAQTSCETFSYGEVEDYSVNITSSAVYGITSNSRSAAATSELEASLGNAVMAPNPASDLVTFNLNGLKEDVKVSVFDIQGRVMEAAKYDEERKQLDIANLRPGIYLVRIQTGGDAQVQRLVKK